MASARCARYGAAPMASERSTPRVTRRMPLAAADAVLRWFDREDRRTPRLLLFGLVVSVLGTFELSRVHPAPWTLQGGRTDTLKATLESLDQGGPILTAVLPSGGLSPSGGTDDQGLYLFFPWLAHALGWHDPVNLLRWAALVALAVPIALYPWLVRELTGSTLGGILSPFALLIGLWLMPLGDIYWTATWVILAEVPVLLLLDRRWPGGYALPLLVGLLVLASLASSIRSQAGLPALIGAVLVLVRRPWPWLARGGAVALCLVAYLSVSTFGMAAARAERTNQLDGRALVGESGTGHPFWHTAYIGLGYLPNKWDIHYFDDIAYRDVLRVDPKAKFLGPAYSRILRERYLRIIRDNPGYAAKVHGAKILVALRPALPALLVIAVLGPWLLLFDDRRARWRRDGIFLGLTVLVALASPIVATPYSAYLLGWLGAVLLIAILMVAATLSGWSAFTGDVRLLLAGRTRPGRSRRAILVTVAAGLAVAFAVAVSAPGIEADALHWNAHPPPPVKQPADATN
jgi:hypothetical protein